MRHQSTLSARALVGAHPSLTVRAPQAPATNRIPELAAADRALVAFFGGRSAQTLRAYRQDLADFTAFTGLATPAQAAALLLARGHGAANELAFAYKADLLARAISTPTGSQRRLSANTINRRLAALRSLVKVARTLGLVAWALEVENVRGQSYRDTRGPGDAGYRQLLATLERRIGHGDVRAVRDRAVVRLLFDLALRRSEVVSLDVAHVDRDAGLVWVLGKGQTERIPLTLPGPTTEALAAWLRVRGSAPGPLFTNRDRAGKGPERRLTGRSLHRIVGALGAAAGLTAPVRPHGLRHAAITTALDRTGGDIRAVQRFSRHKDVRVLAIYDDNREDLGGRVACLVADAPHSDIPEREGALAPAEET